MNILSRFALLLSFLFAFFALLVPISVAANQLFDPICDGKRGGPAAPTVCEDTRDDNPANPIFGSSNSILAKVVNILSFIIGVAAVIMLIVGGISYMLAGGDPGKINGAKNTIIYALIGVVVAVVARGIVALVVNRL